MFSSVRAWFDRYFSDPQVVTLALLLIVGSLTLLWVDNFLAPVLVSIVIAYLLDGLVQQCVRLKVPRFAAVLLVFIGFLITALVVLFLLVPLLIQQGQELFRRLPEMILVGQGLLLELPERYPDFVTEGQVREIIADIRERASRVGANVVSFSMGQVVNLIALVVYMIMVPLLVFFFLKDKRRLVDWFKSYLPENRQLAEGVWAEVDVQIGNYTRGKLIEMLIVGTVSYVTFSLLGLQFAPLLGVTVGLSVLVPFIGAAVVTFPVVLVALFQYGLTNEFWYVVAAYGVIQALDGNVLVPILFSEVVDLHPIAIIVAVLFFGGLWGGWGVFFAIPLATLVQAVLKAWPRKPATRLHMDSMSL